MSRNRHGGSTISVPDSNDPDGIPSLILEITIGLIIFAFDVLWAIAYACFTIGCWILVGILGIDDDE
jgi:hypothetical protein